MLLCGFFFCSAEIPFGRITPSNLTLICLLLQVICQCRVPDPCSIRENAPADQRGRSVQGGGFPAAKALYGASGASPGYLALSARVISVRVCPLFGAGSIVSLTQIRFGAPWIVSGSH